MKEIILDTMFDIVFVVLLSAILYSLNKDLFKRKGQNQKAPRYWKKSPLKELLCVIPIERLDLLRLNLKRNTLTRKHLIHLLTTLGPEYKALDDFCLEAFEALEKCDPVSDHEFLDICKAFNKLPNIDQVLDSLQKNREPKEKSLN